MTQRKHLILILSIFLLCFSFSAFANLDNKSTNSNQNKIHQFDLNYERFYFLYQRKQNKLTINGFMSGISGSYTFRPTDQQIFRIPFLDFYRFEGLYRAMENLIIVMSPPANQTPQKLFLLNHELYLVKI